MLRTGSAVAARRKLSPDDYLAQAAFGLAAAGVLADPQAFVTQIRARLDQEHDEPTGSTQARRHPGRNHGLPPQRRPLPPIRQSRPTPPMPGPFATLGASQPNRQHTAGPGTLYSKPARTVLL